MLSSKYVFGWVAEYLQLNLISDSVDTAQLTVGSSISSGDFIGFHHESSSWSIKEYGTVDNAFSLCTFIGK